MTEQRIAKLQAELAEALAAENNDACERLVAAEFTTVRQADNQLSVVLRDEWLKGIRSQTSPGVLLDTAVSLYGTVAIATSLWTSDTTGHTNGTNVHVVTTDVWRQSASGDEWQLVERHQP
jgi:Domain of unknown function (DUF4440)